MALRRHTDKSLSTLGLIKKEYNLKRNIYMYILLLPAVILVFIFNYLPYAGLIIAFKDFDILKGFMASPWAGFENFVKILTFPNFLGAIKNTLIYSIVIIFGFTPLPIIFAILINELNNKYFKRVAQTVSYFPHFLSWIAVIGLAYSMFALNGPVNDFLKKVFGDGYVRKNILIESDKFIWIIFFSTAWKGIGWNSIIFLAAIVGIDKSLYEAATVDGCNRFKRVLYITLPGIKTTAVIILIMSMGSLVSSNFEQVYGFQNVYTQNQTEIINTVIYRQGIQSGHYSIATAFGMMQGLVSLFLVMTANKFSKLISNIAIW